MSPEEPSYDFARIKIRLEVFSYFLDLFAVAVFFAAFFSLPFPFVRMIWLKEVSGLSGLLNGLFFMVISRSLRRLALFAPYAGLAIVFSELFFLFRSFEYLSQRGPVGINAVIFLVLSVIVNLLLALLFSIALVRLLTLYRAGYHRHHHKKEGQGDETFVFATLIGSVAAYSVLVAVVYLGGKILSPIYRLSGIKFSTEATWIIASIGIGYETLFFLEKKQIIFEFIPKVMTHLIVAGILTWFLQRHIVFEGMLA